MSLNAKLTKLNKELNYCKNESREIVLKKDQMPNLSKLKAGDVIKCSRPSRVVDVMMMLNVNGINNDFLYEYNGKKGVWIEIKKIGGASSGTKDKDAE